MQLIKAGSKVHLSHHLSPKTNNKDLHLHTLFYKKNFYFFFLEYSKNISSISSFVIKNDDVISAIIIILWAISK